MARLMRAAPIGMLAWVLVAVLPATESPAAPPEVVKATPDNGDVEVDPNLKEIRVEFDQDMATEGGFSMCGGGPAFPDLASGGPKWISKRAFVWAVTLKPNHKYSFSINCPAAGNFRSASGESAVPYPITFKTGSGKEGTGRKLTPEENRAAFEELRRAIDERYSYRDLRGVNWEERFNAYRSRLEKAKTPAAFARHAAKLLGRAKDIHMWLQVGEMSFACHKRKVRPNYNLDKLPDLVPGWELASNCVRTGKFPDGIGYIMITGWPGDDRECLDAAFEALDDFTEAKGLIVDVRPNAGGAEPMAQDFAGCFIDEPVVYAKHVYRDTSRPDGFSDPHERVLQPSKERPKFRGKVAVLIGPSVMSSCEAFVLMMKRIPDCTLVGEKTYGSSGNPKVVELSNGVSVYLPSWKSMTPDGTVFEGEGLEPDVAVKATKGALRRRDPVLEAALAVLRE